MNKEFEPIKPCYVNGLKVKVLAADETGYGWSSPCPQLYLTVQNKKVAVIGYENIAIIRNMLNHALSNGAWSKPHTEYTEEELRERMETLHGKDCKGTKEKVEKILKKRRDVISNPGKTKKPKYCDHRYEYTETHMTCEKCGLVCERGRYPEMKYKAPDCTVGRNHDWDKIDSYSARCKKCKTLGITWKYYR